ncbi:MAG: peptidoglycan DD-metalloendopeptidase family protein [Pseudomonadales bacterium]|nr:peptidoglycan DD-metalloendopeptidase family protein [Pseudomonadales bacterium]
MTKQYPKKHVLVASLVTIVIGLILVIAPSEDVSAKRNSIALTLNLPAQTESTLKTFTEGEAGSGSLKKVQPKPDISQSAKPKRPAEQVSATQSPNIAASSQDENKAPSTFNLDHWEKVTVKTGDNLSSLFSRVGLTAKDVFNVSQAAKKFANEDSLRKLYPGEQLAFIINDGTLEKMRRIKSPLESIQFSRTDSGYSIEKLTRSPEIHTRFVTATLENSLFLAGQKQGLPQNLIMELANVFGGVIDFVYDPRKGDSFNLLFEEKFLDGKKIGTGEILAAQFTNRGKVHTALRYEDMHGDAGHYSADGVSMRKAFLRAPLDFTRISSGFNPNRKHPIHKKIRAHRGIDYAAPRGTPVFAAGEGRVVASGYSKANGNYVFIKHGEQYTTKYLHLHKRYVKNGARVKQGQTIGQVGSTGYATGPHLHYEFLVNGVHRNPRTILDKLPKAKSIPKSEFQRFQQHTGLVLAQLEAYQHMLAYND